MKNDIMLERLIDAFVGLPGIGKKSAQRLSYYLLQRDRASGKKLGNALLEAMESIHHCSSCKTLTEETLCSICQDVARDRSLLCIVENPIDQHVLEATGYRGLYFVLLGHLSPLDGIGPEELGMESLSARFEEATLEEVIVATNMTVEGEATAHYISQMLQGKSIKISRLAYGIPSGGELEYVDRHTVKYALEGRRTINI